jgi:hypothetical protein
MKCYFHTLLLFSIFSSHVISSSQCVLDQFQRCMMKESTSPIQCATLSGCESAISDYFTSINDMNPPVIFKYTASPDIDISNKEVSLLTLDHSVFRDSSKHFPISRPFTITRTVNAGDHNVSVMLPTIVSGGGLCANKHMSLIPLELDSHRPGNYPFARVESCQAMLLTSVCLCFVQMRTEAGSFVAISDTRHPLSEDPFDNDLRRRLDETSPEAGGGGGGAAEMVGGGGAASEGGEGKDDIDVDFITHTALVILTVVAFIGNGLFLTYVFCVSAV